MSLHEPLLVFDIGGTKSAAGVLGPGFAVLQRSEIATDAAAQCLPATQLHIRSARRHSAQVWPVPARSTG